MARVRPTTDEHVPGLRAIHDRRETSGRVLIVEEHQLIATGLQVALSERGWHVDTAGGAREGDAVEHAVRFRPDCALLAVHVGYGSGKGFDLIQPLVATGTNVVLLTAERRRTILAEYLEAGAAGWIRPSACLDEVDAALSRVVAGDSILGRNEHAALLEHLRVERTNALRLRERFDALTPREALVLGALSNGLSAEEIARQHFVALTTVRSQIRAVLQKLGVRSQLAAVAVADAHRWLLPSDAQPDRDRRRQQQIDDCPDPELSTRSA
jgi:two-component system, NarL family, nitrate/nitrite response regulator NarL